MSKETETSSDNRPGNDFLADVGRSASGKCHNCKHASSAFKIAGKTHHQCNHPKHDKGFEKGELSPWDTLQEWYNSCETHEFR